MLPSGADRGNQVPRGGCNHKQIGLGAASFVLLLVSQRWGAGGIMSPGWSPYLPVTQ